MKKIIIIFILLTTFSNAQTYVGSFTRLGFGARGMGMGNSLTATNYGEIFTYYNPALSVYAGNRTTSATFCILSLDRFLNFISYTQALPPRGGISAGIIQAGVRKIDGRNRDGEHTGILSTFDYQFFLSFANKIFDDLSIGIAIKLYYSKLFEKITSTTVGFDLGGHYLLSQNLSLGIMIADISSKYRWDTTPIYDRDGKLSIDRFPIVKRIALAYMLPFDESSVSISYEHISSDLNYFKIGAEYLLTTHFTVRSGIDRISFADNRQGIKPSFGFSIKNSFNKWTPTLTYAFIIEPYAPHDIHVISLSVQF